MRYKKPKHFELLNVSLTDTGCFSGDEAEVVIRDKHSHLVFKGKLQIEVVTEGYYPSPPREKSDPKATFDFSTVVIRDDVVCTECGLQWIAPCACRYGG